jgi:pimeloyl-ACP methyl ester carboxylesterase
MWRETGLASSQAPKSGQFVQTSKGRIFVQDAGPKTGVPIVLFHGTAAWSEFWRGTVDDLTRRGYRVVTPDLPPFGYSERSETGAYTRADQAVRILEMLDALKIDQPILVGHSFGAGATIETVMRNPQRVRGLVLVAAAIGLPQADNAPVAPSGWLNAIMAVPAIGETVVAATVTNPLLTRTLLASMLARKDAATPELAAILQQPMTLKASTPAFAQWLQYFLSTDMTALSRQPSNFATLRTPTRILWGELDTVTPIAEGKRLQTLIPGARMRDLPGVGHIPQIEDPNTFRAALSAMLSELTNESSRIN